MSAEDKESLLTKEDDEDHKLLVQLKSAASAQKSLVRDRVHDDGDHGNEPTSFSDEPDFVTTDKIRAGSLQKLVLKSYVFGIIISTLFIPPIYYALSYIHPPASILWSALSLPLTLILLIYLPISVAIRCCTSRTWNPFCLVFFIPALGLAIAWCICLSIFRYHIPTLDSAAIDIVPSHILAYASTATLFSFSSANITTQYQLGNDQFCVAPLVDPTWNRKERVTAFLICSANCKLAGSQCGWNSPFNQAVTSTQTSTSVDTLIESASKEFVLEATDYVKLEWKSEILQQMKQELQTANNGYVPVIIAGIVLWMLSSVIAIPAFILKAPTITYGASCLKVLDQ